MSLGSGCPSFDAIGESAARTPSAARKPSGFLPSNPVSVSSVMRSSFVDVAVACLAAPVVGEPQDRLEPGKAEPAVALDEPPEPLGDPRVEAAPGRDRSRRVPSPRRTSSFELLGLELEGDGLQIGDDRREGPAPPVVRGDEVQDEIAVRRLGRAATRRPGASARRTRARAVRPSGYPDRSAGAGRAARSRGVRALGERHGRDLGLEGAAPVEPLLEARIHLPRVVPSRRPARRRGRSPPGARTARRISSPAGDSLQVVAASLRRRCASRSRPPSTRRRPRRARGRSRRSIRGELHVLA